MCRTLAGVSLGATLGITGPIFAAEGPSNAEAGAVRAVLIGASYAKNWRVSSIRGRAIINKGAQGEQTHELRARFDRDVIEENPAAVIIWGFINNLFRSQSADLEPAMEKARSDIAAMVEEAQKHGLQPVLATEVTITSASGLKDRILAVIGPWLGKESYQDRINERVREVNTWMREFAKERDLVLLDFERVLSDKDGRRARAFASKDGSHISAAGYQALSEYVESITIWRAPQQSR